MKSLKWRIHYARHERSRHDDVKMTIALKEKEKKRRYDDEKRQRKKNSDNDIKKFMKTFALFAKEAKKSRRSHNAKKASSDSSDGDSSSESESLVGRKRDSKELLSTRDSLGSGSSGHLLDPLVVNVDTNKSSNDSMCKELHEYLKNNLFVYNESSCPVRLRKYIREQLEFSPEVAAILLPDVIGTANKNNKKKRKLVTNKIICILLDSGASANTIRARLVKNYQKRN